jgi:hypothetical protein
MSAGDQMTKEVRLCTILVHLRSRQAYYDEMKKEEAAAIARAKATWAATTAPLSAFANSESRRLAEQLAWRPPWRYNDIIGFLEVIYEPASAVLAHLYRVNARRVSRALVRKQFVWFGKYVEVPVDSRVDNYDESVRQAALECIVQATRSLARRGWHADSAEATALLQCADFGKLLSVLPTRW